MFHRKFAQNFQNVFHICNFPIDKFVKACYLDNRKGGCGIMEILEMAVSIVKDLGFPIAVCVAMFWLNNKQTEQHKEEMSKVTEALNNNTLALTELKDRMER